MSLPIPDILERASKVLEEAQKIVNIFGDKPEFADLKSALKVIHPDDLLAVLNEVGKVYVGVHNMQVLQIGSRGNTVTGQFEVALQVEYGLGTRQLVVPLPPNVAQDLINNFTMELSKVKTGGTIISSLGSVSG